VTGARRLAPPAIEARSIDYVPAAERHGRVIDQGPFWFLGNFHFVSIALGFVGPSLHLSLTWTAVAGTCGILFGGVFQAFHASQGAEMGLPQMIQSRAQFGYRGVVVPLAGALFTFVGFNVVDTMLVAQGLHGVWGVDSRATALALAAVAAGLAIWGHDWLHGVFKALFRVSLPLFVILTGWVLAGGVAPAPTGAEAGGFAWSGFLTQFAAAASYNITYAPYVSDYSRYLPRTTNRAAIIASVFAGASLSAIWLIWLGAWLATRMGATDGLVALVRAGDRVFAGFGGVLAAVSVAALTATMGMNAYSGMLTAVTGVDSLRPYHPGRRTRVTVVLILAAIWLAPALAFGGDAVDALGAMLVAMLYLLAPWTAVNLVDYFWLRKGRYAVLDLAEPAGIYGAFGARGLAAYFIGFFASVPFFVVPGVWTGPAARALGGVDLAWLVSLAAAALAYLLASRGFKIAREAPAIAASEAALAVIDAG
jgi:purine-cytosine permease-like protein